MEQSKFNFTSLRPGLERAGLMALCLLVFDIASTGSGRYLTIGWLSPRIVLAAVCFLCALPLFLTDIRRQIRNPLYCFLLAFLIWTAFEAVRGYQAGNNFEVWKGDIKGFAWLALFPLAEVLVRDKKDRRKLTNFALAGAGVQVGLCVLFNILFAGIVPDALPSFVERIWEATWGTILACEYNAVRIFCRSSLYMAVACVLLLGRLTLAKGKQAVWYAALFLLNFFALFYTYTRSVYLCLAIGLAIAFICLAVRFGFRRVLLRSLALAGCFLLLSFPQLI